MGKVSDFQTGKEGEDKDVLAREMAQMDAALTKKVAAERRDAKGRVRRVLRAMRGQVADRGADVMGIMGGSGNKKESLLELVGDEMTRLTGGRVAVLHYAPELKTQQEVWLYVGTHWMRVENDRFFQFVKECCTDMGIPTRKVNSPTFMADACQTVAYRLSAVWDKVPQPDGVAQLNLMNGTLEVDGEGNRRLRAHSREDYFVHCLPYAYEPGAECERWLAFLERVLPDRGCQRVLQEYVANALVSGAVKLDVMLILKGSGANGKSVLLEVLGALAGKENVSNISLNELTGDVVMRQGFEHKLLNMSSESESKWVPSVLKQLTSHEPVMVKELYRNPHEMTEYGYLIAAVNEMPRAEATDAFYRRLRILPFNATISPEEADPEMPEKLKAELPGILNWFLEGLPALMKRKRLSACKVSEEEVQNYRGATDYVYLFVQECCAPSEKWVTGKQLHDRFKYFCESNNLSCTMTPQRLYDRLKNLGVKRDMRHNQVHFQLALT